MKRSLGKKNITLFAVLSIIVVILIILFTYFFRVFNSYDKNEYNIEVDSILFDKDYNYIKVEGKAILKQRYDGNYYLYETKDKTKYKYKIGPTAVVYKNNDTFIYLYGNAYQVLTTGDVNAVAGETKITKTSPTKFFKLADRKYLFVDSEIRSLNDDLINTKNYLLIELDKQGNATFANQELNFKAIKPVVITGSVYNFDIANENLLYDQEKIDLKNIIGSTNEYKNKTTNSVIDGTESKNVQGNNNSSSNNNYYDDYFKKVINSVNNLTTSVGKVNEKTTISKSETYYDFSKWVALKSVTSGVSTITLNYNVFDPNSEYQAIYAKVTSPDKQTTTIYLNKNNTEHIIRNLLPDSIYEISFGYQTTSSTDMVETDAVKIKTAKPNYTIKVDKIISKKSTTDQEDRNYYSINYTLTVDKSYSLYQGTIIFENQWTRSNNNNIIEPITNKKLSKDKTYSGTINLPLGANLNGINIIKLEDINICAEENSDEGLCRETINLDLNVEYKFYNE